MGRPKQLLELGGRTVLSRILTAMGEGGIEERYTVLSHDGTDREAMVAECERSGVEVITNSLPDAEMAETARVARDALSDDPPDGYCIATCDQPLVDASIYSSIVSAFQKASDTVVIPVHTGRRGHPVIFPRAALQNWGAPATLREIVRNPAAQITEVPVASDTILDALDTPQDYARLQQQVAAT